MARDQRTISFEFFPPKTDEAAQALESRLDGFIELAPSFVSVTYGAGGSTRDRTHDLVVGLAKGGRLDPIPHLTCVGHRRPDIEAILSRYAAHGIGNILALRGDLPQAGCEDGDYPWAIDLVKHIVAFNAQGVHEDSRGFGIGVAGFPEGHAETPNQLRHMEHLVAKVAAGADWITTCL